MGLNGKIFSVKIFSVIWKKQYTTDPNLDISGLICLSKLTNRPAHTHFVQDN